MQKLLTNSLSMKRSFLFAIIVLKMFLAIGQQSAIEGLKNELRSETNDTTKAITQDSLFMYYLFFTNKTDSSFHYANQFLDFAFGLKDKKYLPLAYARMGFYYVNTSQYKAALDISEKGIRLAKEYNDPSYLSALYYNVTWVYLNLNDPASALQNAFDAESYLKYDRDDFMDERLHLFGIIGNIFVSKNNPDSAASYFTRMDSVARTSKELAASDISAYYWSIYYLYKGYNLKADSTVAIGISSCEKNGDFLLDVFHLFSANSNLAQGKLVKAVAEAKTTMAIAASLNDIEDLRGGASLLNSCYDKLGNRDSAYYYLKLTDSLGGVIASKGSADEIQHIRFDQQLGQKEEEANLVLQGQKNRNKITIYVFLTGLIFLLIILVIQLRNNKQKRKANTVLLLEKEKVEATLSELKSAQKQLIQSAKMASLGELTAGIAHEIQNPLNFINNFSEINRDLMRELNEEMDKKNYGDARKTAADIDSNEERINHHGKRAEAIVKGMLLHSRSSTGTREPTDINALVSEYSRLSLFGMLAKDKSFHADVKTDFDQSIGKINIVSQDIGRALLNIYNNALYAVGEKAKSGELSYQPAIYMQTKKIDQQIEIRISDNGNGIPAKAVDKIFQPFFTTKPTGQGTGLGLSLSYDIIKAHDGEIRVETKEGEGATFTIQLPAKL